MPRFLLVLCLAVLASPAVASDWDGNLNLLFGHKNLSKDDWGDFRRQGEFGILTDFKKQDWPLSIAIDILVSAEERTGTVPFFGAIRGEARTSELDFGARKVWEGSPTVRPFIGGGLGIMGAAIEYTQISSGSKLRDDDSVLGAWLCGGVYWTLGKAFNLGLQVRLNSARVELFGSKVRAGGAHSGLMLGYHWGA